MKNVTKRRLIFFAALVIVFLMITSIFYIRFLMENNRDQIFSTLTELSHQNTTILKAEVEKGIDDVANVAAMVGAIGWESPQEVVDILKTFLPQKSFLRMGIAGADGLAMTTDGAEFNISDRQYFQEGMEGRAGVSNTMADKVDNAAIIVFSAPIYNGDEVAYVLFGTYSGDKYQEKIATSVLQGEGYTYVIDGVGNCVVNSNHPNRTDVINNFFCKLDQSAEDNRSVINVLKQDMASKKSGLTLYRSKQLNYLYYEPAGINDWYLLTMIPKNLIQERTNKILIGSYLFILLCTGMFCVLLFGNVRIKMNGYHEIEQMAYVDPLTGGNTYGKFKLDAVRLLQASPDQKYAIISLDVDNFQVINELYGYEVGDEALCYIWRSCKEAITANETVARVFDDHFVALAAFDTGVSELKRRFKQFAEKMKEYHPGGGNYTISLSAGVYLIENHSMSIDAMLNRARIPQKEIKGSAISLYALYQEEKMAQKLFRKQLENQFEQALKEKEFVVYFQPKFDLADNSFYGAEALVRWIQPDKTMVMPGVFIPVFEQNGDIARLDEYMLREVCANIERWQKQGLYTGPISVNVSRFQLLTPRFVDNYMDIIHSYEIPVSSIQLEFTESMMVENESILKEVAADLHRHGILVQMDDFGSGYSCLSMLMNVPIDVLKLDKRFVDGLINDEKCKAIVMGAISLAHTLGITVTAEGVENQEQFAILKQLNCDAIQGYYCARPMEMEKYEGVLRGLC